MERAVPQNFIIYINHDGNDTWVATGKGLGWAIGEGYYAGLKSNATWLAEGKKKSRVGIARRVGIASLAST